MKRVLVLLMFMSSFFILRAQEFLQQVSGRVLDEFRTPLAGATVSLVNPTSRFSIATDESGKFSFDNVPAARYAVRVFFVGFVSYEDEVVVLSSKRLQLDITLQESSTILSDITVTADSNSVGEIGVRTLSIEKTMRVPANFFDPVRMLTSYPGVVAANDQNNSIIVKGYSPNALLWRLQGLDIVNPNHLANAGTLSDKPVANGGGVNVLSAQLLDKTDFYSGGLPVQYGNALSGALNMSLRAGDKNDFHFTGQASLIGLDVAAETPIVKGKSSLLANYRYSTVGLLSNLGVNFGGEVINFQDFSFHYDHDQKKNSHLSVFGFGGLSSNRFDRKPAAEWEEEKDRYNIDFEGKVVGIGFTEQIALSKKTLLKLGSAFSGQFQERESESAPVTYAHLMSDRYKSDRVLLSNFVNVQVRLNNKTTLESGIYANHNEQTLEIENYQISYSSLFPLGSGGVKTSGWLIQPYVSSKFKLSQSLEFDAGLRYVNSSVDKTDSWEPRLGLTYKGAASSLQLNFGITSQQQPVQVYLWNPNGFKLISSKQWNLHYQKQFNQQLKLSSSLYYHELNNATINFSAHYSIINVIEEILIGSTADNGKGRNYGWELFLENKFQNQIYVMGGGSLYRAEYTLGDDVYLPSRFDGRYTVNISSGKEWNRKKNTLGIHLRVLYLGGMREREILTTLSQLSGSTQFDLSQGFVNQLPDYFRTDARISWRKNKSRYTRTISIDIQNLTGQQNVGYRYFDTFQQSIQTKYQLGTIPILVYRVDF